MQRSRPQTRARRANSADGLLRSSTELGEQKETVGGVATDRGALRVLHVVEAFGGGVFEIVRVLAEGLAHDGHTVAIAHGRRPETPWPVRDHIDPLVELYAMPWEVRSLRAQAGAIAATRRLVREWKPDVVHLHSSFAGVIGALTLPSLVPTVYTPQGYSFTMSTRSRVSTEIFRLLERYVAARVTVTGACSESEGRLATRAIGASPVRVVCNGIPELDAPEPIGKPAGKPLVVSMGRTTAQRQPEAAARILKGLVDVANTKWVGGVDQASPGARALIDAGVHVTGWMPRDEAVSMLRRAIVYLHWTAWDGLPLSVLEAMANDVVVVASDIPANRDVLGSGQVCTTEDDALALIRRVLQSPETHAELLRAQRLSRGRFSARTMVTDWTMLYRDAIAGVLSTRPITSRPQGTGSGLLSARQPTHSSRARSVTRR